MNIGYARVSTTSQDLTEQKAKLTNFGCDKVFAEKMSGKNTSDRVLLEQAMDFVREGDAFVITKLDRLARSVTDLGSIAQKLESKGVDLVVLEQDIDTSSASGKLMFHMIAAFAEFERELISERCSEGRERAKQNGVVFGRKPSLSKQQIAELRDEFSNWEGTKVELADKWNISRASLYRLIS